MRVLRGAIHDLRIADAEHADGDQARRQPRYLDEVRLRSGIMRALEKRPVTAEQIEDAINHIKRQLVAVESREISSREIGAMVMHELQRLDQVAYIRFASVYLSFEDIQAFQDAIQRLAAEPTPEMHQRQVPLIEEDD